MLEKIISGGQTGADRAGWRAAKLFGIPTGGWMPSGFIAEDGLHPEFADEFGVQESPSAGYPDRTRRNVADSDATIFFGNRSAGYGATYWACVEMRKPIILVSIDEVEDNNTIWSNQPSSIAAWITRAGVPVHYNPEPIKTLNIAGNRESSWPGIGEDVEKMVCAILEALGHERLAEVSIS
jgi:hypothetical protein